TEQRFTAPNPQLASAGQRANRVSPAIKDIHCLPAHLCGCRLAEPGIHTFAVHHRRRHLSKTHHATVQPPPPSQPIAAVSAGDSSAERIISGEHKVRLAGFFASPETFKSVQAIHAVNLMQQERSPADAKERKV